MDGLVILTFSVPVIILTVVLFYWTSARRYYCVKMKNIGLTSDNVLNILYETPFMCNCVHELQTS